LKSANSHSVSQSVGQLDSQLASQSSSQSVQVGQISQPVNQSVIQSAQIQSIKQSVSHTPGQPFYFQRISLVIQNPYCMQWCTDWPAGAFSLQLAIHYCHSIAIASLLMIAPLEVLPSYQK